MINKKSQYIKYKKVFFYKILHENIRLGLAKYTRKITITITLFLKTKRCTNALIFFPTIINKILLILLKIFEGEEASLPSSCFFNLS